MKINKETFAERLDFLMQDRKMNTQCISEYTGASEQSVRNWREGRTVPPMSIMIKLCDCLGTSYDYLVGFYKFNRQIAPINNNDAIRNRYKRSIERNVLYIERLAQCAEEATELSLAFSKMRRTYLSGNPTTVNADEAAENLIEELADLMLCMEVIGIRTKVLNPNTARRIQEIKDFKLTRWVERLRNDSKAISETARKN